MSHIKKIIRILLTKIIAVDSKKAFLWLKKMKLDAVTFDVFDTLVKRNLSKPDDVFCVVSQKFEKQFGRKIDFLRIRKEAENAARRESRLEEVSLEEIYDKISGVDVTEREWLYQCEVETEIGVCQVNLKMKQLYQYCIEQGLKLYIISDMYLPEKTIIQILHRAGYSNWTGMYVSSSTKCLKSSGKMFSHFLSNERLIGKNVLHIGDSLKGDYIRPIQSGMKAILVKEVLNNKGMLRSNRKDMASRTLIQFLKNNKPSTDWYADLGYCVLGPLLYGYVEWLSQQLEKEKISKLFFLTREGELLKKAFEIVNSSKNIETRLLCVSRKATVVPLLYKCNTIEQYREYIYFPRKDFMVRDLLVACGMSESDIIALEREKDFSIECTVADLVRGNCILPIDSIIEHISRISIEQNENIRGYLRENNFEGKVAISDVGWHGTIQNALQNILLECEIMGFYQGVVGKKSAKYRGFLFEEGVEYKKSIEVMFTASFFEMLFLSTDGTCREYRYSNELGYYAVKEQPEQTYNNIAIVSRIQEQALCFVRDFYIANLRGFVNFDRNAYFFTYENLVNPPTVKTINNLKRFTFLNVGKEKLVSEHCLIFNLGRLGNLFSDFLNSSSKLLYAKSVMLVPLPYLRILCCLKDKEKKTERHVADDIS